MSEDTTHKLTVRLNREQYGRLGTLSRLLGVSMAGLVRGALADYLDSSDRQILGTVGVAAREYAKEKGYKL